MGSLYTSGDAKNASDWSSGTWPALFSPKRSLSLFRNFSPIVRSAFHNVPGGVALTEKEMLPIGSVVDR